MDIASLGKLIKTLRKEKKMTQEDLASKLGVTISAISKWETGKNSPDISMLHKLSEILNISLEELYSPEETLLKHSSKNPVTEATAKVASVLTEDTSEKNADMSRTSNMTSAFSTCKLLKYKGVLLIIVVLSVITFIGIMIYLYKNNTDALNICPYSYRITEDEIWGTVYECGCVYEGNLNELDLAGAFMTQLSEDWISDNTIPAEITIQKVSFYATETDATQWNQPQKSIYLYR